MGRWTITWSVRLSELFELRENIVIGMKELGKLLDPD
jgi:hypothetical protein